MRTLLQLLDNMNIITITPLSWGNLFYFTKWCSTHTQ